MNTPPTLFEKAKSLVEQNPLIGRGELARALGCSKDKARHLKQRALATPTSTTVESQADESRTYSHNDCTITLSRTRICTLEELIAHCKIDTRLWEVERWVCNKWEMGSIPRAIGSDEDGWSRESTVPQVTPLFQVKAWLRRRKGSVAVDDFDRAYAAYRDWIGWKNIPALPRDPTLASSGTAKYVVVNDLHAPFHDDEAMRLMIQREAGSTTACIVAGDAADFFNHSRFRKLSQPFTPVEEFRSVQKMLIALSEAFREVVIIPGNHDGARMIKMLSDKGVPGEMFDYFELLCPGFCNPLSLMIKDLPNVKMVDPVKLDYANLGFLYQVGDLVITHAENYSKTPLKAAGNVLHWLQSFALPEGIVRPFKHVAQAHTHGAGKAWADYGCWAYELGCMCLYPDYVSDPQIKTPRPWKKGYTVFWQEDGVTDPVRSNFIST